MYHKQILKIGAFDLLHFCLTLLKFKNIFNGPMALAPTLAKIVRKLQAPPMIIFVTNRPRF
jgi:hypothetical protein